ncbi:Putative serine protease HhoB precursor [Sporomusa ovata DSM 2662]|uniref:HtrA protease/chaperone protein n=1 Tax=Sporomusa ovata TaxID=2378 RepID=A0A0U1L1W7_9FIRM|nr:trypsin-like peptidase domain-containing protein [Sporomusa ovata]EQB25112.1 trypsin-like serine protease [Sporomusa ovata DSM 2662]CQR73666.1 HtrA protease/chaperone protein [Sporomusa ovata]
MKHNEKSLVSVALLIVVTVFFTVGLILGGGALSVEAAQNLEAASPNVFLGPDTIQTIVKQAGPAVVKIETETQIQNNDDPFLNNPFFRDFFGEQYKRKPGLTKALGSGFIISKDGYIVTNNHVVAGAEKIHAYLTNRKEPYAAKLIGSDEQLDLAILKIDAGDDLPSLEFGDSNKLEVGSWVIAIGNPYGLDHTVTVGVISAKGRPLSINGNQFTDLLQTDASINPGNSGGPLINLQGKVIGINTAINAQAQGIGFAIPSSTVTQVVDQLINEGKVIRPWLGIYMQPITKELANYFGLQETEGVLISAVAENSPAQKAGLKRGDIILEYNKKKMNDPDRLKKEVSNAKIGEKVVVLIYRDGKTIFVPIKIEAK